MSSFLQKLKGGGTHIDNNSPPDNTGTIVRRLEKHYATEPSDQLGLILSDDAEIQSVAPASPAAVANIPERFMIFEVNNEFVENRQQFMEAASRNLNLVIKLQSLSGVAELIAKILMNEEARSTDESTPPFDLDELFRTTPRYNFLSGEHPLFRRYTRRLQEKREATALIKQRAQEAAEQQKREIREAMRREIETAAAEAARKKEEEERTKQRELEILEAAKKKSEAYEPFVKVVEDESAFARSAPVKEVEEGNIVAETSVESAEKNSTPTPPPDVLQPISATELLALIGVSPPPESNTTSDKNNGIANDEDVRYVAMPSEEYTLSNGDKVICVLKSRIGPLPSPPPGKPPKISRAARNVAKRTPLKVASPLKPTTEDTKSNARSHEICRDYRNGKCYRGSRCSMRHISPERRDREKRRRSDSYDRRRRRRDSHSREGRRRYRSRSREHTRRRRY